MKELKPFEIASVKRQFLNSLPTIKKIEALNEKIAKLQEEKETLAEFLKGGEQGIMRLTGGYMSTDLIKCSYVLLWNEDGSPKTDKEGRQLKKRVLEFVPPVEDNEVKVIVPPTTEGQLGSDFDADTQVIEAVTEEVAPLENVENPFNV